MRIINIEDMDKVRRRIHLEDGRCFWLYRSDLREYQLEVNQDLSDALCSVLRQDKVLLYAKKKTLELLERMDRTEEEIRIKLRQRDFSDDIIDEAILYAKQFHYIDDYRFACNYIQMMSSTKSKKQILYKLYQKGVSKSCVNQAYDEFIHKHQLDVSKSSEEAVVEHPEVLAIKKIMKRKGKPLEDYSKEELQKLSASLYCKGFSFDHIRTCLSYDFD